MRFVFFSQNSYENIKTSNNLRYSTTLVSFLGTIQKKTEDTSLKMLLDTDNSGLVVESSHHFNAWSRSKILSFLTLDPNLNILLRAF